MKIVPGRRVCCGRGRLIALNSAIGRITAPMQTVFNFVLLGSRTVQNTNSFPIGNNGNGNGNNFNGL